MGLENSVAMKRIPLWFQKVLFFFSPILPDWEMRVLWYSQTARNSICIHKSRFRKMCCNIVKYHLDM